MSSNKFQGATDHSNVLAIFPQFFMFFESPPPISRNSYSSSPHPTHGSHYKEYFYGMLPLIILLFLILASPLVSRQVGFLANNPPFFDVFRANIIKIDNDGGVCGCGVVLGVRSRGSPSSTRNLHFLAEIGVRGTH